MGSAQGEESAKEDPLVPDVLAQLYGFRMLQPPGCPKRCTAGFPKAEPTIPQNLAKCDFPEAHLRMKGIGQKNLGCEGLNPLSPIECGRLEVWYYRLRIRKEMFYLS